MTTKNCWEDTAEYDFTAHVGAVGGEFFIIHHVTGVEYVRSVEYI
jgi:hypothetical protein